jgi:very-short-patch-repair endonuclease/ribonuclease HI
MEKKNYIYETANKVDYDLLKQYAEENKLFMTDAEHALWNLLRGSGIGDKFRRQHIVGEYIADFVNLKYKLIVEVDGKYHFKGDQPVSDEERTADLNRMGYTVVRFTNDEVIGNTTKVGYQIQNLIKKMKISYPSNNKPSTSSKTSSSGYAQGSSPLPLEGSGGGCGWAGGCGSAASLPSGVIANSWAVDAACSGNPGPMEYQAIDLQTGAQVFHFGPLHGTNNIGEFLAIVHALALMDKQGIKDKVIYSDSYNAILWVKKKQCKTKLVRTPETEQLYQIIARAEQWLRTHNVTIPVLKWETKKWGEVPADFGRK